MNNKRIFQPLFLFYLISLFGQNQQHQSQNAMYFVTVADSEHYHWLLKSLLSINKYNHPHVAEIAIFNLGLTNDECENLLHFPHVKIYEIEKINPYIYTKFIVRPNGRLSKGWYSWKPIVLKQASDLFPYFLYIDSGIQITNSLEEIFAEIKKNGYYLIDCGHSIWPMTTVLIREKFELEKSENRWILDKLGISAGLQGLSRILYKNYILPMYEFAHNITNFADDGTAYWGFGGGRHDQAIFSILARKLKLKVHKMEGNPAKLRIGDKKIYFESLKYFKFKRYNDNPLVDKYKLRG